MSVVLAGVRPEEIAAWKADDVDAAGAVAGLAASSDAQAQTIERASTPPSGSPRAAATPSC